MKAKLALLLLLPLSLLLAVIYLAVFPNDFWLQSRLAAPGCGSRPGGAPSRLADFVGDVAAAPPKPDFRLLIGILTLPDAYERRSLVRHAYLLQQAALGSTANAEVDVRFVFCNLTKEEQRVLVAMEIMLYDDIIILNCAENMNDGKTYTYFSSLPGILERPYDYVIKTDDDTYFRLDNLAATLEKSPREDVYLGLLVPCRAAEGGFMSGMGYLLSWDVVEWISTSGIPRGSAAGPEDILTAGWLQRGGRGRNKMDMNPRMYDYPEQPFLCFRHEFIPDTIAVHKLKDNSKWAKTLRYFNVTHGLKPSQLYHID